MSMRTHKKNPSTKCTDPFELSMASNMKRHNILARKIAESSQKKLKYTNPVSSRLCGHCDQKLSLKVFKRHERLYRRSDLTWITNTDSGEGPSSSISGM